MIYRLLLGLYPSDFRQKYGEELEADFDELCREARARGGHLRLARCWMQAAADLMWSVPREWIRTPWIPVLMVASFVAFSVFYYVVGRVYGAGSFDSDAQPPESPHLVLLMGLMVAVPVAVMILVGIASRLGGRFQVRRRVRG